MMQEQQPPTPPAGTSAGFIEINSSQLYYEEAGSGHPLVLIQGRNFLDRRIWDEQFTRFAHSYRVIRYDGRGFGKSPSSTELYTQAGDLAHILHALMIESAYLLDLGGNVALDFIHEYPSYVDALLLVSPSISPFSSVGEAMTTLPQALERLGSVIEALRQHDKPRAIDGIIQNLQLSPSTSPTLSQHVYTIVSDNLSSVLRPSRPPAIDIKSFETRDQWLPLIQVPTLLLMGKNAPPEIQSSIKILEQYIPGAQRREIAHAQFLLNIEQPEEFNDTILTFLSAL